MLAPLQECGGRLINILVQIVVLCGCLFVVDCTQLWAVVLLVTTQMQLHDILVVAVDFIQGVLIHLLLDVVYVSEHYFLNYYV